MIEKRVKMFKSNRLMSIEGNGFALEEIKKKLPIFEGLIEDLESLLSTLPIGVIDNFYAYQRVKAQYDEKNKLNSQVEQELRTLMDLEPVLKDESERCQANINKIQRGTMRLHLGEVKEKMYEVKMLQGNQLNQVQELGKKMQDMLEKASNTIKAAQAKQCPPYVPVIKLEILPPEAFCTVPNTTKKTLDDLFEFGPIKKGF